MRGEVEVYRITKEGESLVSKSSNLIMKVGMVRVIQSAHQIKTQFVCLLRKLFNENSN